MSVLRVRKPRALEEARALGGHPRRRRHLHVVAVHPRELLGVEDAGAVADVLEREAARELVDRHQLGIVGRLAAAGARRPADQREVVGQRLGQVAALAELRDRRRAVPLRQRRVIRDRAPATGARSAAA